MKKFSSKCLTNSWLYEKRKRGLLYRQTQQAQSNLMFQCINLIKKINNHNYLENIKREIKKKEKNL